MSREHKVHLVEPRVISGYVPYWLTICPVRLAEAIDPHGTTRDPEQVTCGHCLRILKKRGER